MIDGRLTTICLLAHGDIVVTTGIKPSSTSPMHLCRLCTGGAVSQVYTCGEIDLCPPCRSSCTVGEVGQRKRGQRPLQTSITVSLPELLLLIDLFRDTSPDHIWLAQICVPITVFGHIWRIWHTEYGQQGVSLKRSSIIRFRCADLKWIQYLSQKSSPNQFWCDVPDRKHPNGKERSQNENKNSSETSETRSITWGMQNVFFQKKKLK